MTVVETTREQIDTLIREVYSDNLDRQNEKRMDFVKLAELGLCEINYI